MQAARNTVMGPFYHLEQAAPDHLNTEALTETSGPSCKFTVTTKTGRLILRSTIVCLGEAQRRRMGRDGFRRYAIPASDSHRDPASRRHGSSLAAPSPTLPRASTPFSILIHRTIWRVRPDSCSVLEQNPCALTKSSKLSARLVARFVIGVTDG